MELSYAFGDAVVDVAGKTRNTEFRNGIKQKIDKKLIGIGSRQNPFMIPIPTGAPLNFGIYAGTIRR
jgi:hypothetical protein